MANEPLHQTYYTRQVQRLRSKIYGHSVVKDSLLDRAIDYFEHEEFRPSNENLSENEDKLHQMQCTERYSNLYVLSAEIIELTEGDTFDESNRKSAQFLGTIQLTSPTEGKKIASHNEQSKSLYNAILCLRLLDRLIMDSHIDDPYINKYLGDVTPEQYGNFFDLNPNGYQAFVEQVKIPLVMAALLLDIGHYHPKAQVIMSGVDGELDPFRILDITQRKDLLKINYQQTLKYLNEAIGVPNFVGNTKAERESFYLAEREKISFIQLLLKSNVKAKAGIGNLLKVPQIYSSIILSTKDSYNYKLLPQVYQVLNKNAELGVCAQIVVDALYQITGMFPQGFGIVYMPFGDFVGQGDCYEYAIVNSLYPPHPEHPICRIATRKLTFIGFGQNIVITNDKNLYFTQTAKKLAALSKERLNEILELLSSNAGERQQLDLLPRCWQAKEYFSIKSNQKLWNKAE